MRFAGLSGGIGCGKSTVAAGLTVRGAVCIDVDQLSRALQQPGQPVFVAMVARWGDQVLGPDGTLDRTAVAAITFADRAEMAALMAITSHAIEATQEAMITPLEATDAVVVLESALLRSPMYGMDGLLVVDAPEEVAMARLASQRGMTAADAQARMAHQPARRERLERADFVIHNAVDDRERLEPQLDAAMAWLRSLPVARYQPRRRPLVDEVDGTLS